MANNRGRIWYSKSDLDYWGRTYGWGRKKKHADPTISVDDEWRRRQKHQWSRKALLHAINRWCSDNQRRLSVSLDAMSDAELGDAVLTRAYKGGQMTKFSYAPDDYVYELDERKLFRITTG